MALDMTEDELRELRDKVARTRAAQGLPPTIQDPGTLERVAAILRLAQPAPPDVRSEPNEPNG